MHPEWDLPPQQLNSRSVVSVAFVGNNHLCILAGKPLMQALVVIRMELTDRTIEAIEVLFSTEEHKSVKELLLSDCSNSVAGCSSWKQENLERLWLSVLKISSGNMEQLYSAIALAQTDYRDLFMSAGFGHDVKAHKKWVPQNVYH